MSGHGSAQPPEVFVQFPLKTTVALLITTAVEAPGGAASAIQGFFEILVSQKSGNIVTCCTSKMQLRAFQRSLQQLLKFRHKERVNGGDVLQEP